jgi:predicted aspartyl protease
MTPIFVKYQLPFVAVVLRTNRQVLRLEQVLLDTGSAATVFKTDDLLKIGVQAQSQDRIRFMSGIGGQESVVEKQVDTLEVGEGIARNFNIQLAAMNYGFELDGILGFDFLRQVNAIVDLQHLELRYHPTS